MRRVSSVHTKQGERQSVHTITHDLCHIRSKCFPSKSRRCQTTWLVFKQPPDLFLKQVDIKITMFLLQTCKLKLFKIHLFGSIKPDIENCFPNKVISIEKETVISRLVKQTFTQLFLPQSEQVPGAKRWTWPWKFRPTQLSLCVFKFDPRQGGSLFGWFEELVRFVSFWKKRAKSEQAKSNHLQAASSKSMSTAVSWSRWGLIWDLLGSFGSF